MMGARGLGEFWLLRGCDVSYVVLSEKSLFARIFVFICCLVGSCTFNLQLMHIYLSERIIMAAAASH